ncbi:DNA-binding GntR family transcriptional regulator [Streptomyces canus]|uniref:DNA-binding GntR family transcriptional regulator n=1 Tax=Streptomyces canus TaxID=58343 RepID=A0AAW8FXI1_9ACTN|nr:GntR family transcriptional regulator [Streptomyces canus]MDQ0913732.1 DNA-binding GntR family transcriptional regulator [Streptomyces canus]
MSTGTVADMVDDLRQQIDSGALKVDEKLPSTRVLMETYGLSNNAVYRGVALLKAQGYTYSRQGAGVFVRDRRAMIGGARRIKGITQPGESIHWRYSVRTQAPDWVAEYLGEGECVERARTVRRGELILQASRSWVHIDVAAVVPEIDEPRPVDPESTWQAVYAERSGVPVRVVSVSVGSRLATEDDREALSLGEGACSVTLMWNVYAADERVIGVGEAVYPSDQRVELKIS